MTLQSVTAMTPLPRTRLPNSKQPPEDEAALSERVRQGDQEAFLLLWQRYETPIYHHVYRYMANATDAQDVLQDVFLRAWLGVTRVPNVLCFGKWLYRVAGNACIDVLRHKRVLHWVNLDTVVDEMGSLRRTRGDIGHSMVDLSHSPMVVQNGTMLPETNALSAERSAEIMRVLEHLPERWRLFLMLREYEELSYDKIAEVTGTSVAAVKTVLWRAREAFRKEAKRQKVVFE